MSSAVPLTEGSISDGLLELALPTLLVNVLLSLNGSINSIWVGHYLGEAALTATSNANLLMFLIIGASFGMAVIAAILVGQRIGAKTISGAKNIVGASAALFLAMSAIIGVSGLLSSPLILRAMNTPEPSLRLATTYIRVLFVALPPAYMYAFLVTLLRSVGDSKTPLYFMSLSIAIDIALNPVFIFGLGPLPRLGIAGSALATLIAQTATLSAMLTYLYRQHHILCLEYDDLRQLKIDRTLLRALICKGIPTSGQLLVTSLSSVLMISIVNHLGIDMTAAFGAALQLWNYAQMPALAVGQSVSAMAAQNVGAGKWDRVDRIAAIGVAISLALTGAVLVGMDALGACAFTPFLPTHSVAPMLAAHLNSIAAASFLFLAVPTALFEVERSAGAVTAPLIIMATTLVVVRYPLAAALSRVLGADAIWWSFPTTAALAALLAALHYKFADWRCHHLSAGWPAPVLPNPSRESLHRR